MLAPITLFVYNRPWHTRQTLEALAKNKLADQSHLIIYCDGPKSTADNETLQKIKEVREVIREKQWCKTIEIIESEINKGLANSIIEGVTRVVNEYGKIIVLEDDLVTSEGFLTYMNDALSFYEKEDRVMQIAAYQYINFNSNLLHRRTTSWGWGTWTNSWQHFEKNIDTILMSFNKKNKYRFNIDGCINRFKMLEDQKNNKIDSWAIRWAASVSLNNGLVLWPQNKLIKNIGLDGSGTHCGIVTEEDSIDDNEINNTFPIEIIENKKYLYLIKQYYSNYNKLKRINKLKFWLKHKII